MNTPLSFPLTALLVVLAQGFAQAQPKAPTPKPTAAESVEALKAVVEDQPDPAVLKAMKSQVFVIHHRDVGQLAGVLRPLGSGTRGTSMSSTSSHDFNAISVRDFPENLAAIEDAIKRLDVPSRSEEALSVELRLHVLLASKSPVAGSEVPADLEEVIKGLKGTLSYRSYNLAASFVQRAHAQGEQRIEGYGVVDQKATGTGQGKDPSQLIIDWSTFRVRVENQKDGAPLIQLKDFQLVVRERTETSSVKVASFHTDLSFKEGEQVVVGTSVVKDRGLIVVLKARLLK